MRIREEFKEMTGEEVWKIAVSYVMEHKSFKSVTGVDYTAGFVGSCIFIKGGKPGTKRAEEGEYLTGKDFIAAYDLIRNFDEINTSIVKPYIKRQQSPFIGLLCCAGIIE